MSSGCTVTPEMRETGEYKMPVRAEGVRHPGYNQWIAYGDGGSEEREEGYARMGHVNPPDVGVWLHGTDV